MSSMEENFISGCLQDPEIVTKARRAKIKPSHLEEGAYRYLYRAILEVAKVEPPTPEVVKQHVSMDSKRDDHAATCRKIDKLAAKDISGAKFSVKRLEEYRIQRDLVHAASGLTSDLLSDEANSKDILKAHHRKIEALLSRDEDFDIFDYFEDWGERQVERQGLSLDSGDTIKFIHNMAPFADNLPRGQARQEMTAVAGPTYSGKSVLLSNLIYNAAHPDNGFNCLYIFSENRKIQAGSRLDSIFLDRDYNLMYESGLVDPAGDKLFKAAKQEGWGEIFMCRVTPKHFTANTMKGIIEDIEELYGVTIDSLFCDSPEHQVPIHPTGVWHLDKGEVWMDNKNLSEDKNLFFTGTVQMKGSAFKSEHVYTEDVAGSQEIGRHLDNMFAFNTAPEDRMLNRGRVVVTKARDGDTDFKEKYFYFEKSHRLVPWHDIFGDEVEPGIQADEEAVFRINQFRRKYEGEERCEKTGDGKRTMNLRKSSGNQPEKDSQG